MAPDSRVLGAVEVRPGLFIAEVRDLTSKEAVDLFTSRDPAFRPWMIHSLGTVGGFDVGPFSCWSDASRPRACGCRPGAPCHRAMATAARWGHEWQKRTDARDWRAEWAGIANRPAGLVPGPKRATRAEAEADAQTGWPFVVLRNGHYDELERYEVTRGA